MLHIYIYSLLRKRCIKVMSTAQHSWHDYKMRHNSLILVNEIVDHWDKDTPLQQTHTHPYPTHNKMEEMQTN